MTTNSTANARAAFRTARQVVDDDADDQPPERHGQSGGSVEKRGAEDEPHHPRFPRRARGYAGPTPAETTPAMAQGRIDEAHSYMIASRRSSRRRRRRGGPSRRRCWRNSCRLADCWLLLINVPEIVVRRSG